MTIDSKSNKNLSVKAKICEEPITRKIDESNKHEHNVRTKASKSGLDHTSITMMEHYIK